jgi:hypothetical protein
MFNPVQFYEFGKKRIFNNQNLFIGGVANTLTNTSLLANKLGILASDITNFKLKGQNISATINKNYVVAASAFLNNYDLSYFIDLEKCTGISSNSFTSVGLGIFSIENYKENVNLFNNLHLHTLYVPNIINNGNANFNNCTTEYSVINQAFINLGGNPYSQIQTITKNEIVVFQQFALSITNIQIVEIFGTGCFFSINTSGSTVLIYEFYDNDTIVSISNSPIARGLLFDTFYTLKCKIVDKYGNRSGFSNSISFTTKKLIDSVLTIGSVQAFFDFENIIGTTVTDLTGNYTNNVLSSVQRNNIPSQIGNSINFKATNLNFNVKNLIAQRGIVTVFFWVRFFNNQSDDVIVGAFTNGYIIRVTNGNLQFITVTSNGRKDLSIPYTKNFNTLNLIIMEYDGARLRCWINNVLQGVTIAQTGVLSIPNENERIGAYSAIKGSCTLGQFGVYGKVLPQSEKDYLYNNGNGVTI